jgi:hypothetical protein
MKLYLAASTALLFGAVLPSTAATIYSQPAGPASTSQTISSTLNFAGGTDATRMYDDFTLASAAALTEVSWWGLSDAGGNAFTVSFYAGGATPGALLASHSVTPSSQSVDVGSPINPMTLYSATLPVAFNAAGGTTYWLSIFNGASDAIWSWISADDGGNGSLQQSLVNSSFSTFFLPDRAFTLGTSADVPEPSTLLLVLPALGLALFRRRRL